MTPMFGWTRSEMEGQNVSMLCPQPFAKLHNSFMQVGCWGLCAVCSTRIYGLCERRQGCVIMALCLSACLQAPSDMLRLCESA